MPIHQFPARETTKGDFIEVAVAYSSARADTRTASATVRNSPPRVPVSLSPEDADTSDDIVAMVDQPSDADGDKVDLSLEWRINDVVVDDVVGSTLPAGRHVRDDRVTFTVIADDGEDIAEISRNVTVVDAEGHTPIRLAKTISVPWRTPTSITTTAMSYSLPRSLGANLRP